jgi:hypothetical protein
MHNVSWNNENLPWECLGVVSPVSPSIELLEDFNENSDSFCNDPFETGPLKWGFCKGMAVLLLQMIELNGRKKN